MANRPRPITAKDEDLSSNGQVAILMLHGLASAPGFWRDAHSALSPKGFVLSSPALPGHGDDIDRFAAVSWNDWASSVEKTFNDLAGGVKHVFIMGHSLGATLALNFASESLPNSQLRGLILMAPAIKLNWKFEVGLLTIGRFMHSVPLRNFDINRSDIPRTPDLGASHMPISAIKTTKALSKRVRESLPRVNCPTLILNGTLDRVIPHGSARYIASEISSDDKEIVNLENSRHAIPLDNDRELAFDCSVKFIHRVLEGNSSTPGSH